MSTIDATTVEQRTQALGRALLNGAAEYRPGPAERLEDSRPHTATAN